MSKSNVMINLGDGFPLGKNMHNVIKFIKSTYIENLFTIIIKCLKNVLFSNVLLDYVSSNCR